MNHSSASTAVARGLKEFPSHLARFLAVIASAVTILAALLLTAEVLSRAIFDQSIRGLFEIMQPLVVLIAFLGLAEAERAGDHIRVTILTDRLPRRAKLGVHTLALVLSGLIVLWMLVMSWIELDKSIARGEFASGLLDIPVWPARVVIVIGLGALFLMYVQRSIESAVAFARFGGDGRTIADDEDVTDASSGGLL